MTKKDIKTIEEMVLDERKYGYIFCDFDDYRHDLMEIADAIGIEMIQNEDEEWVFKTEKQKQRVEEALQYYYDLH